MSFSVRWYQPGDENAIVSLLDLVFDGWPKFDLQCTPLEHWIWKYGENLTNNTVSIAELDGEILGCLHVMKTRIKIGENIVVGEQGSDLAVHPDFRGKGVYNKMNAMFSDLNLAYSVSGNPIVYNKAMRLGDPFFPKPISFMLYIGDIDKHLKLNESEQTFLKKYGFKTLKFFYDTRKKISKKVYQDDEIKIDDEVKIDRDIDTFWNNNRNDYDFIIARDAKYLNWRFIDPRSGIYKLFWAKKNDELAGYSVLSINYYHKEYPVGTIVDMISRQNDDFVLNKMLNHAVSYFRDKDVNCIRLLTVKDTPLMREALNQEFIPAPNEYRMFFSSENKIETDILIETEEERLHFTFGDTDNI